MYAKATDVSRVYTAADVAYANTLQQRAIKLDFAPPLKAYETLHRLYFPLRFKGGLGLPTQHPVLAGHQRVAEENLHAFARNCDTVLELGPSLHSAAKLHGDQHAPCASYHGCTKTSTRDSARHTAALQSRMLRNCKADFKADAALLSAGIPSKTFCVDGTGSCAFKSQVGIANHSLYDITLEELANAFDNHGLMLVRAFMHMPEELLYMDEVVNSELGYRFKVIDHELTVADCMDHLPHYQLRTVEHDLRLADCKPHRRVDHASRIDKLVSNSGKMRRYVIFSGDDDWADAYVHDFHTWLAYLLVRNFPTPFGFSLHIEVQRRHGSSIELRITRASAGDRIVAVVPRTSHNLCRVPNIFSYADDSGNEPTTILTSQWKVNMLLNFMQTRPEKELNDLTVLMSFARARLRAIIVATEVAESSWNISPADLVRVVASAYIIHLIERKRAQLSITKAREEILGDVSLCRSIKKVISSCCGLRGGDRLFSPDVVDKYSLLTLNDIICDVRLTPDEVGFLPGRIPPVRVYHDREELEVLRGVGIYQPEPELPSTVKGAGGGEQLWQAACASLPEFVKTLETGLNTDVKSLKITLENALDTLKGLKLQPVQNLSLYEGPPGSGKTGNLIAALDAAATKTLYIAPTRELRTAMDTRVKLPSMTATQHIALSALRRATAENKPFVKIVVDECFMYPLVYVAILQALSPSSDIILVGDVNQIGFIDFTGLSPGVPLVSDVIKYCDVKTFKDTKRCPSDVVATPFFQSLYPGTTTTSKHVKSISYVPADYRLTTAQVLCFTQEEKSRCGAEGAMTIHEAQGRTFSSVILHYNGTTAEQKLLAENAHLLVGITRHTNHLYVRDSTGDIERKLSHSAKAELFIGVEAPLEVNTVKPSEEVQRNETMARLPPQQAVPAGAIHILRKAFGDQPDCGCIALAKTSYEVFGGVAKINIELAEPDSQPKQHKAFQEGVQWVKVTNASNKHQALQTLLSRYTKRSRNLPEAEARQDVARMLTSLDKHWTWEVTDDAVDRAVYETQVKFTQRGGVLADLVEPDDPYIRDVQFLMKTQQKVSTKPMNSGKVGQGIAAHSKSLNFILAVWVRILEEVLRTGSKTVRYSNGLPDDEEAMLLEAKINQVPHATFVSADWTEFDTAHNNTSELLFSALLRRVGTPEAAITLFRQRCGRRTLRANGIGSAEVEGLLDSGAVWTLCRNTVFSAAVMLTLFTGVKFAAFKGDDSLLCGSNFLRFTPSRLHMGEYYSKKHLKVEVQKIVPYIGLLVTTEQVVIDPIRSALKVFGRCYSTAPLYHKYVEAVRDITSGWRDARYHALLQMMASTYYNFAPESAGYVIDAVIRFGNGDFAYDSLTTVRPHVQSPDASTDTAATIRDSCLDFVFEPRCGAPEVGNIAVCAPKTLSGSDTAKPGVPACRQKVLDSATGIAQKGSLWVAPAVNSSSASSTLTTQCTSSLGCSSSSLRLSRSGRSHSGGDIVPTTARPRSRKLPLPDRLSRSSECLDKSDAKIGSLLTAHTATARSCSFLVDHPPKTAPTAVTANSPLETPFFATVRPAVKTTPAVADNQASQSAPVVAKPYRPPTIARWKAATPIDQWVAKKPVEVKEDATVAALVSELITAKFRNKNSSGASERRSSYKSCPATPSSSIDATSVATKQGTAGHNARAPAAATTAGSCHRELTALSVKDAPSKRIHSTMECVRTARQ